MKTFIINQLLRPITLRHSGNTASCLTTLLLALVLWPGSAFAQGASATLLNTFTNPTPADYGFFGGSVTAVGSDRVLIGKSGAAYLFDLPYPPLSIARNAATVSLKWVTPETGLALQQASVLNTSTVWSNTSDSVSINGLTNVVQQTVATTNRFFRLHRP